MVVHVYQVHKETITKVPKAKEGRDSIQYEIYGMEGIPDDDGHDQIESMLDVKKTKTDVLAPTNPSTVPSIAPPYYPPQLPMAPPGVNSPIATLPAPPALAPPRQVPYPVPSALVLPPGPMGYNNMNPVPPPLWGGMVPPPPPPHPLFPVFSIGLGAPGPASPVMIQPGVNLSVLSPRGTPTAPPTAPTAPFYLVFSDENTSMEEKRADLEKYRYDEEKIKEQVHKMNSSIESRLNLLNSTKQLGTDTW